MTDYSRKSLFSTSTYGIGWLAVTVACGGQCYGQAIPPQAIRQGQQLQSNATQEGRAQELERERRAFQQLKTERHESQCPSLDSGAITRLEFGGASDKNRAAVQAIIDHAAGKGLDCAALDNIRAEIYELYDRAGFPLTQIHTERPSNQPGTLRLVILEAKIGESGFCKNNRPRRGPNNAFPLNRGQQFTLKALDQGIDNLNQLDTFEPRVPLGEGAPNPNGIDCAHSQGSTVTIKPGSRDGEGIVTVQTIQRRPFFVTAGADNLGSRSTGRTRVNAQIAIEDVLGLYERFEVAGSHTADFSNGADRARNLSGAFTVPAGYWRVSLSANYFDYRSTVAVANQNFVTSGDQGYYALDVDRVVSRNQTDRLTVGGALAIKNSNNFVNDLKLVTSSRQLTLLSGRISYDHSLYDGDGAFAGTFSITQGLKQFGALDDPALTRSQPHAQFTQIGLVLSYRRDIHLGKQDENGRWSRADLFRFQSLFSGSFAPHSLYGTEQVQIGGPFTVRGFDDMSLNGDVGGFVRNELSYIRPFRPFGEYGQIGLFGAIDGGLVIRNYADDSLQKALSGIAGGLRASGRNIRAEARVEKSIASPSYFGRNGAIFRFTIALSI